MASRARSSGAPRAAATAPAAAPAPRLRRVVFWGHLAAGVVVGLVVLLMSVTGVLLTYEKQMLAWADARAARPVAAPPDAARRPLAELVAAARAARPGVPTAVTLRAERAAPVAVAFGREATVFVDPYRGAALGEGARGMRRFFASVTSWHRWLGRAGDDRAWGRSVTGAANLAFLFLVLSGCYLWLPRRWTRVQLRNVTWFRRGLTGRARDFSWHNVIGVWSALPLAVVVASAAVISYPWASDLVYRAVGERPPARPAAEGARAPAPPREPSTRDLDALLARAERQLPGWRRIQVQLPAADDAPVTFALDAGTGGQPQRRAQLVLERSGAVKKWEPFGAQSLGRRARAVLRFAHTGEVLGLAGQTVAGLASLGAIVLVWTGLALAWRRLRAWRARTVAPDRARTRDADTRAAA